MSKNFRRQEHRACQPHLLLLLFLSFALSVLLPATANSASALQVTLVWNPNTEVDLGGYRVYSGTASRNYASRYDAGSTTSYTLSNLQAGKTYYFAATAYDVYGNESDFSEEVSYTVETLNNPPVARAGTLSTLQDTAASGVLSATDPDGDSLTFTIAGQGAKGTAVVTNAATGAYSYTPALNATGTDSFSFQARDPGGLYSTASVAVTITPVNHAPVAQAGTLTTEQNKAAGGVLIATDQDGDSITYAIVSQAGKGTAVVTNAATGVYTYTPKSGLKGNDSFTFRAKDPSGLTSTATIAVTITPENHAPTAKNGTLVTVEDTAATGTLVGTDVDGNALKYQLVSAPKKGIASVNSTTGSYTYTPNSGITGTDTFTFKANDGKLDSNTAAITVTIKPHVVIQIEAEKGSLTAPMTVGKDNAASGRKYIYVPNGKGNLADPTKTGGQARFSFKVTVPGNYYLWGRVADSSIVDNSLFVSMDYGPFMKWNTALGPAGTWVWDRMTDSNTAAPISCYLNTGTHTLLLKQSEDGTSLDQIVITTQPGWVSETVYSNGEDGSIDGWDVFDADPAGALISNVYDEQRESSVIELAGSGVENGYRLRSKAFTGWANSSQFVMAWSMKYAETFVVYVEVKTSAGVKYLQYEPLDVDYLGGSSPVRFGVGSAVKDGEWHTFVRDLQADLKKAQPGVTIQQVNSFSIRGNGKVDDIKLRQTL